MPVYEAFTDLNGICLTDVEDEKEKTKQKAKELFSFSSSYNKITDSYTSTHYRVTFSVPLLLHTVETPPPDFS